LRTYGRYLRLRAGRRTAFGPDALSRAVSDPVSRPEALGRQYPRAVDQIGLPAAIELGPRAPLPGRRLLRGARGDHPGGAAAFGARVHARARRGEHDRA